jgi:lactoylglutathione lyase
MNKIFHRLRTIIYYVDDMQKAKEWYIELLEQEPYFNEPFYIGFDVNGFELGLHPRPEGRNGLGGTETYWSVADINAMHQRMLDIGAKELEAPHDVGGPQVSTVTDPWGNVIGLISEPATSAGSHEPPH